MSSFKKNNNKRRYKKYYKTPKQRMLIKNLKEKDKFKKAQKLKAKLKVSKEEF